MKIGSFSGTYRFLSNFYPSPVWLDGDLYPTVEHAFQAAKVLKSPKPYLNHGSVRRAIQEAATPGEAKRMGRRVSLRPDWEKIKQTVMLDLLRQKFGHGSELCERLLATGDAELEEGNHWGDRYWGTVNGVGQNHLGRLLMQVRKELKSKT